MAEPSYRRSRLSLRVPDIKGGIFFEKIGLTGSTRLVF